jgi:hypothetical protein
VIETPWKMKSAVRDRKSDLENELDILGSRQLKIVTLLVQSTTFAVSVGCPWSKGQYRAAWPAARYWQMHF